LRVLTNGNLKNKTQNTDMFIVGCSCSMYLQ
jgi:hypothetical protein